MSKCSDEGPHQVLHHLVRSSMSTSMASCSMCSSSRISSNCTSSSFRPGVADKTSYNKKTDVPHWQSRNLSTIWNKFDDTTQLIITHSIATTINRWIFNLNEIAYSIWLPKMFIKWPHKAFVRPRVSGCFLHHMFQGLFLQLFQTIWSTDKKRFWRGKSFVSKKTSSWFWTHGDFWSHFR